MCRRRSLLLRDDVGPAHWRYGGAQVSGTKVVPGSWSDHRLPSTDFSLHTTFMRRGGGGGQDTDTFSKPNPTDLHPEAALLILVGWEVVFRFGWKKSLKYGGQIAGDPSLEHIWYKLLDADEGPSVWWSCRTAAFPSATVLCHHSLKVSRDWLYFFFIVGIHVFYFIF